jgi:hypothetical protein
MAFKRKMRPLLNKEIAMQVELKIHLFLNNRMPSASAGGCLGDFIAQHV